MRDTPRTDKLARGNHIVPTEWAEDLEREVNQLRQVLQNIRQLAQGHTDKIVLLATVSTIARVAGEVLEEKTAESDERINIRRLENLGFVASAEDPAGSTVERAETEAKKISQSAGCDELSDTPECNSMSSRTDTFLDTLVKTSRITPAFEKSIEVLGSVDKARCWFTSPQKALGDKTPLEFCDTDTGTQEVCNLLGRLEHGVFT